MDQSMYRHIKELAPVAYAHLKIIESERGTPADLLFLDVNKAFEELAGLREQQVVGRKATEVFPGIGKSSFDWIGTCGEVALQGTDKAFEAYCASLGRHLRVTAYAPEAGEVAGFFIATTGTDGEDTLPKEEERRRRHAANILAATGAGIWEWNVQTGEVVFGERSAEILGHSLQEIHPFTISDWFERTHPTDLPACREMIDQHLSGRRERFECEHRVLHRKGHWLWVANRGKVIAWNPQGRPLWVYGTLLDIAERKSARQEAEEQRKRLTNILEGTGAATWEWNVRTGELLVNRRWAEMLGYRLEELQPGSIDTWKELTHPEDLHHSMAQLERHFRGETPRYESELRMRHRDGRWIWMVDRGKVISRTEAGEPLWVYGTHLDITARKEAREEIARQRERLANIIEGTEAGTWEWNVRTGETIFNERTARILGYRLADLEPTTIQTWVEIAHPEDFQRCQSLFREHLKGPKPFFECEHRVWHGDGRWIWIQDRGKVVSRTETGEPLWVSGIILDVTARKEAEEKLRISEERATAANRAKSSFLATVSHEIRTPMNGVLAMTGLLFDTPLTPKQRHYAEIVRSSGEALLHLINDILDYSRIEAGKLSLECEDFDLQDMLDDFADSIALQAHHKGLEFVCTLNPDVPTLLWGDPGRLRQVLTNLAGNAIKFTEQGEVTITCSSLCTTEREVLLRFSVRDTGIGIPEKDRERLFEEFARLEGEAKQNEGTGLGLAISRRLVELMGGEIGVESTPGEGSTFRFTARLARQSRDAGAPVPLTALGDIPILIADRNDLRRESLRNTTAAWGMRSTTAANGVEALDELTGALNAGEPYRLALIDSSLPGMEKGELALAIGSDPNLAKLGMVLLTSLGSTRHNWDDTAELFDASLTKPVRQRELQQVLLRLLSGEKDRGIPREEDTRLEEALAGRRGRILVAEDNSTNQKVLLHILESLGQSGVAAASGKEVLQELQSSPYDLVFMDLHMPGMDGIEATRRIRTLPTGVGRRNAALPIIAMSGHTGQDTTCLQAGMNDVLHKPVEPAAVAETLRQWLPSRSGQSGTGFPGERPKGLPESGDATEPPAAAPSTWDQKTFLDRVLGNREAADEVVRLTLQELPGKMEGLRKALEQGNAPEAEQWAHAARGIASNIGADALYQTLSTIETAAGRRTVEPARSLRREVERQYELLLSELRRGLGERD